MSPPFLFVLLLTLLAHITRASVLPTGNAMSVPLETFPVSSLGSPNAHPNIITQGTLASSPFDLPGGLSGHPARQESPETLFVCAGAGCTGICVTYDLSTVTGNLSCEITETFVSVLIFQPSGLGLPYNVVVGPIGCELFVQIPGVNVCYNTGASYADFGIRNFV